MEDKIMVTVIDGARHYLQPDALERIIEFSKKKVRKTKEELEAEQYFEALLKAQKELLAMGALDEPNETQYLSDGRRAKVFLRRTTF